MRKLLIPILMLGLIIGCQPKETKNHRPQPVELDSKLDQNGEIVYRVPDIVIWKIAEVLKETIVKEGYFIHNGKKYFIIKDDEWTPIDPDNPPIKKKKAKPKIEADDGSKVYDRSKA